jgi:hypothetical protein
MRAWVTTYKEDWRYVLHCILDTNVIQIIALLISNPTFSSFSISEGPANLDRIPAWLLFGINPQHTLCRRMLQVYAVMSGC